MQEEHEAILRRRENPDSGLTWKEYKSMTFTFQVDQNLTLAFSLLFFGRFSEGKGKAMN